MDKVIIDGIDVSECDSFLSEHEFPNNLEGGYYTCRNLCECGIQGAESYPFFCKDNNDCYYKQLMLARAEIERLEDTCNELRKRHSEDTTKLSAEVMELRAENEKLKEDREQIYKELIHRGQLYNIKIDAYIQCLKEIKEIADIIYNTNCNYISESKRILDKISECQRLNVKSGIVY